ncbi:UDP-2,3-diacylglucosamine diphosphatase [Acetobacteraceae bacterium KSS8]|uniref:UDP-2,3-diacylglucosamine diphosphatase n=1 Tax=Endosaccharibacter trunci TaxID=2812733 RepID=A0ABT1W770_9PROT|nr:UDP-2,3-diacylglucosamine diphosphatase [Acetobacteraceae bacterium KSS8]
MNAIPFDPAGQIDSEPRAHYRTVFISDLHLGTRGSRADFLADFLSRTSCDRLFLVGDIIDGWRLRRSWYWDAAHDEVLRLILKAARGGTEIVYIPGNHDEMFRAWLPMRLEIAGIKLCENALHVTEDGRRLLVMHGDEFDSVVRYAPFLALLGDRAYAASLVVNRWFNLARRRLGLPYRSLSAWLKRQVKGAVKAIDRFEEALASEARRRGVDGVVCGHIHHAEMREIGGVLYINDGDWVESCTALVEHAGGRLELIDWAERRRLSFLRERGRRMPRPSTLPELA